MNCVPGGLKTSYNIARWYRSGWGRYTKPDPLGLDGGPHLYGYALNNPLRWIDALGLTVQLYCRPLFYPLPLSKFNHCFVRVKCDGLCKQKYDVKLEVGPGKNGLATFTTTPPSFAGAEGGTIVPIEPPDWNSKDCATEDCLRKRWELMKKIGYAYESVVFGQNSNTFAEELLYGCGITKIHWPQATPPFDTMPDLNPLW